MTLNVPIALIRNGEKYNGYRLITEAPWLIREDWEEIVISQDRIGRIRLVLLHAKNPGNGAFARLILGIKDAKLVPVIVEPLGILQDWCVRHNWRRRVIGQGDKRQEIWYERIAGIS